MKTLDSHNDDSTHPRDASLVLLTTDELALRLRKSPKTLERWRQEGKGPRWVRIGRTPRYRKSDVLDWLVANTVSSTSELT